jgi:malonate-semialdehyde dehydrogenase (acetylating)/methylmalonate-semialdehyde dehydrogenase
MPGLSSVSQTRAEELSSQWKGTNFLGGELHGTRFHPSTSSGSSGTTKNFIDGEFRESKTEKWIEVLDPVSYVLDLV